MEYKRIDKSQIEALWELQILYKSEIGENEPQDEEKVRLTKAIVENRIVFFGAFVEDVLVGSCSITVGFSTFDYLPCGVFEDFYIHPDYRHKGIARHLVQYAYRKGGISSMTVGCADCDIKMYHALGFSIPLGNLLAFEE